MDGCVACSTMFECISKGAGEALAKHHELDQPFVSARQAGDSLYPCLPTPPSSAAGVVCMCNRLPPLSSSPISPLLLFPRSPTRNTSTRSAPPSPVTPIYSPCTPHLPDSNHRGALHRVHDLVLRRRALFNRLHSLLRRPILYGQYEERAAPVSALHEHHRHIHGEAVR